MANLSITIIRQASEAGHLYGSIRSKDICDSVSQNGFSVDKSQVIIPNAIKNLGHHVVKLILHPEVVVELKLLVAQSLEEAAAVNAKLSTQQEIIETEETTDTVVA
jgi:large subunit ribosomal protein L9